MRAHRSLFVLGIMVTSALAGMTACSGDDDETGGTTVDGSVPDTHTSPVDGSDAADAATDTSKPFEPGNASFFSPLPAVPADPTNKYADNPAAAKLGQHFFFDKDFSGAITVGDDGMNGGLGAVGDTKKVACADCHGSDATSDSRSKPGNISLGTAYGPRNALNIENSSFYTWTNWGGKFDSQWSLPPAVLENAAIMNSTRLDAAHLIYAKYKDAYNAVFTTDTLDPDLDPTSANASRFPPSGRPGITTGPLAGAWEAMAPADQTIVNRIVANFGKAIAAYVRLVVSRNAPFDKYVAGDPSAIGAYAIRGFDLFIGKANCASCHAGPLFSDNKFHALGVPQTGPNVPATDLGRNTDVVAVLASAFNTAGAFSDDTTTGKLTGVAQSDSQKGQFRTKSLRNLTGGAPYMHDGLFTTLDQVVAFYVAGGGDAGVPVDALLKPVALTASEQTDLIAFLNSLNGEKPDASLLTAPP